MLDPATMLPIAEVRRTLGGVSAATIYNLIKRDGFPSPVKIGARSFWPYGEVDDWRRAQANRRPTK